ncbi:hypothetical protein KIS1582_3964 [Cytobacillus firmus]|uniref:Uncharacterized protein n=1 Tax=Cytobacillus firmus TaxID=1399 RepID=A0A800N965_CYTFI|nr:hypothetical protein KIS1582_3964 [Cytobacillus firmus]
MGLFLIALMQILSGKMVRIFLPCGAYSASLSNASKTAPGELQTKYP